MMSPAMNVDFTNASINGGNAQVLVLVSPAEDAAGVSRLGYYWWLSAARKKEKQEARGREDFELILEVYRHRGY